MVRLVTTAPQQTQKLANSIVSDLNARGVIALKGQLGAGKTEFAKGVAKALGIRKPISSPTFTLHKHYPFRWQGKKLFLDHLDLYRIRSTAEAQALGLSDLFRDPNRLVLIEWPEVIRKKLPETTTYIEFSHGKTAQERKITIHYPKPDRTRIRR